MKMMVVLVMVLFAATSFATSPPVRSLVQAGPAEIQGAATNPLTLYTISNNFSLTTALYPNIVWFSLDYAGAGTCYVRLMNNQNKASWPQIPVYPQSNFSRVVHPNAIYLNYSGCGGVADKNSLLEEQ